MTELKDNYIVLHGLPHLPVAIIEDRAFLNSGCFVIEDSDDIVDMVMLSLDVFFDKTVKKVCYCIDRKYTGDEQTVVNRVVYDKREHIVELVRAWDRAHFHRDNTPS